MLRTLQLPKTELLGNDCLKVFSALKIVGLQIASLRFDEAN